MSSHQFFLSGECPVASWACKQFFTSVCSFMDFRLFCIIITLFFSCVCRPLVTFRACAFQPPQHWQMTYCMQAILTFSPQRRFSHEVEVHLFVQISCDMWNKEMVFLQCEVSHLIQVLLIVKTSSHIQSMKSPSTQ